MAGNTGLNTCPATVAELGPGDSLGIGLAALLSGCGRYLALDIVESAAPDRTLAVCDELIDLFCDRAPIPGEDEFPRVKPYLTSYEWPGHLLDDGRLSRALENSRSSESGHPSRNPTRRIH